VYPDELELRDGSGFITNYFRKHHGGILQEWGWF